eukprot:4200321-Pleurochrysis_carterae.AAC.1
MRHVDVAPAPSASGCYLAYSEHTMHNALTYAVALASAARARPTKSGRAIVSMSPQHGESLAAPTEATRRASA